jgi:hypothetical protein
VCCVAFYGCYQLRDEVVPLLELYVNVGECVFTVVAQFDQAVVSADAPDEDNGCAQNEDE